MHTYTYITYLPGERYGTVLVWTRSLCPCVRDTLTCVLITLETVGLILWLYICQTRLFVLVDLGRVGSSGDEPRRCIIKEAEVHER